MEKFLKVLHIEDSPDDSFILERELRSGGFTVDLTRVETALELEKELSATDWDLVICDYDMPEFNAADALSYCRAALGDIPFIIFSGAVGEDNAIAILKAGAQDYIMKAYRKRIVPAIERELRDYEIRKQRKAFESQLRLTKYTMDNSAQAIAWLSPEGDIVYLNHAVSTLTKTDKEALVGSKIWTVFPEIEQHWLVLWRDIKMHTITTLETEFTVPNQPVVFVDLTMNYMEFGGKEYAVVYVKDITERKRKEEEIRQKNEELARFTYAVSHDLKSPLVTIKSFIGYLEKDLQRNDTERVAKDIEFIGNAAEKMGKLLDELLELSRIGRKVNPPVEVMLKDIAGEALALVAGRVHERNVQVEISEKPVMLYGDRTRLREVFQNLLDNAVKFMGDQPAPRVEIGSILNGESIVLFVRDNGKGVEPAYHKKLFDLFEKLDQKTDGTGIGLTLVKRIVEIHGGKIWLESGGIGAGTTFYFTLEHTKIIQ